MTMRKIALLGEIGVGKTSIAERLVFDRFGGQYRPTIGGDFYYYDVVSPDGSMLKFLVVDTDGNYGDAIFREGSLKGASGAMVVGDVRRWETLERMVRLAEGFQDHFPARFTAMVLNKLDLLEPGEEPALPDKVTRPEFPLYRTSAKTGANVQSAFQTAVATIVRRGL